MYFLEESPLLLNDLRFKNAAMPLSDDFEILFDTFKKFFGGPWFLLRSQSAGINLHFFVIFGFNWGQAIVSQSFHRIKFSSEDFLIQLKQLLNRLKCIIVLNLINPSKLLNELLCLLLFLSHILF